MSRKLQQATEGLSNDGGAQVAHVHLLGNVRRGEIHNDSQLPVHWRRSYTVHKELVDQLGDI